MDQKQSENSGFSEEVLTFLKNQHIHFLLPMYGGQCSEATFIALMKFVIIATKLEINYTVDITSNESLITRGRNNLVSKFMCNPNATHLMFIDSDIGFDAEAIFRLLLSNQDIVGGAYPMKNLPIKYVLNKVSQPVTDGKDLVEVSTLGTGFLMVKRHVIEKMIEAHPHLKYKDSLNFGKDCEKFMYALFDTMIDPEGHYLSEDWTFCYRWRQMGGRVFVNTSVKLDHTGYYKFCGDVDALKKTLGPLAENISTNSLSEEKD